MDSRIVALPVKPMCISIVLYQFWRDFNRQNEERLILTLDIACHIFAASWLQAVEFRVARDGLALNFSPAPAFARSLVDAALRV